MEIRCKLAREKKGEQAMNWNNSIFLSKKKKKVPFLS